MAELNASAGANRHKGIARSKKLSTRVDLTPMVDLGFLLITFFIFTTTMSESRALDLNMPVDDIENPTLFSDSKVLTLIPLSGDSIMYYHGEAKKALREKLYGFAGYNLNTGIGQIIRMKQQALEAHPEFTKRDIQVIIRPSADCNYKNVVDLLDEMLINDVHTYSVAEITDDEKQLLMLRKK